MQWPFPTNAVLLRTTEAFHRYSNIFLGTRGFVGNSVICAFSKWTNVLYTRRAVFSQNANFFNLVKDKSYLNHTPAGFAHICSTSSKGCRDGKTCAVFCNGRTARRFARFSETLFCLEKKLFFRSRWSRDITCSLWDALGQELSTEVDLWDTGRIWKGRSSSSDTLDMQRRETQRKV